jgi:hypothetical protein
VSLPREISARRSWRTTAGAIARRVLAGEHAGRASLAGRRSPRACSGTLSSAAWLAAATALDFSSAENSGYLAAALV